MAEKFKMPNKKTTIIIGIIIAILAIVAVTGTVVFLKDRGSTEAADLESEQVSRDTTGTSTQNDQQVSQNEGTPQGETAQNNEQTTSEQNQNNGVAQNDNNQATGTVNAGTTGTTTTTGTAGNTGTTTTTDNIQETTISRTEEVQIPERKTMEGHYVGWTPMQVNADINYAKNIVAQPDNLEIHKVAKTATGENLVTKGEEITYEISVKNNSEKELKGIEIKDNIPTMTEYKSGSVDNNGEEVKETTGNVIGLKWNIDLKVGEEKVVSFKVTVAKNATGTIENVAFVNGESTKPVETAVVTATKTATIEGKEEGEPAKVGDKITYTITVVNTEDIAGSANVKDESLAKLVEDGILKIDEASKETATKVMEGTVISVPGKGEGKISFTMVVEKINGAIKNIATVGEEKPETTVNTVNITGEKSNTDTDDVVKPGDTFDYTIVLTNSGNVAGTATVTDEVPEGLKVTGTNPTTATLDGRKVDFGDVTVAPGTPVTLTISVEVEATATGDIKNVGKVDGKDVEDPETIKTVNITAEKANNEDDNKVKPGDTFDYTITLTNNGNTTGTATVTDEVPEGLKVTGTNPTTATVDGRKVDFGDVEVAPGTPVTLTISVEVEATATGDIKNVGKVDGKDVEDPETIKTVNITAEKANNEDDNKVKPGDTFDYTITLTNNGNTTGTATVTDEVPEGLKVTGTNPTATVEGRKVDFGDVEVAPGTPVTLTISVEVEATATGDIKNVGKVDGKDVEDPETIKTVNITGEKSNTDQDNIVKPGDTFDYTIVLTNSGNTTGSVTVTDDIPDALEITGTTPTSEGENATVTVTGNHVDFGNVEVTPGTPVTLTISVKVKATATGTFKNVAKVDGKDTPDTEVTIENVTNITATKGNNDTDGKVKAGDVVTYTINLSNSGNVAGTTTVTDRLPSGVIYQESSDNGVYSNTTGTVIWNNVNVPVGTNTKQLTVTVKIDKTATGRIVNTAIVENEEIHDGGLDLVKITATKSSNITSIAKVGQEVVYTIKAINNGTIAGDATITDQVPSTLELKEATLTAAGEDTISKTDAGLVTWNVKGLEPGAGNARVLTIKATIKDFTGTTENITNEVKVDNEKTSETTIEAGRPLITSTKTSEIISCPERNELTGNTVHEGDKIKYTITVRNTGAVEKVINVTDQIKDGLSYVDGTLTAEFAGKTVTGATVQNGVVKLENYTLTTGGTLTITFTVEVNTLPEGVYSKTIDANVAVVDGADVSDEGGYEVLKPIISSEKTSAIVACSKGVTTGTIVHENDQIKYIINVYNTGRTSGKVTIEDTIPEGLSYVAGSVTAKVDNTAVSGVSVDNGKLTLTNYSLAAGKTLVIEFTAKVNTLPTGVYSKTIATNVATVNGTTTEDNKGEYNVVKPNVESSKSSAIVECSVNQTTGKIVHENDKVRYTITVENNGTDSDVVNVTDTIPAGLKYVTDSLSAKLNDNTEVKATISGRQIKVEAYTLAAGKTLTITFDATVDTLESGVYSKQIANNVAVVNGVNVPDNGGYEVQKPQIESSKVVDKQKAEYDEELTYTITAKNLSTTTAEVSISDPIPEGTEYVPNSITVNGTAAADANNYKDGKVVYTGTLTKQNETVTITFKVKVTEKAIGTLITNKANINNEEKQATTKVVKRVTVGTESTKVTPIDLVFVLDVSGSMNTNNKIGDLRTASQKLADKVFADETTSTISVITYSKSASDKGTYTYAQRNNLKATISGLTANGGTNIYAALNAANTKVSALGTEREKVVVFLTDGSPTIPDYIRGVHSSDNADSGFTNNVKDKIVKQAKALKTLVGAKGKVYSIGLGLDNLSTTNVRSASECTLTSLDVTKSFDTENHTFTITIANPTGSEITLEQVDASFSDISKLITVKNGEIRGNRKRKARWSNVKISANGSVTLTGTYEPDKNYGWDGEKWAEVEREPSESSVSVDTGYKGVCITEEHQELYNGKPLYTVIKTADEKQYHGITEKDYANYLLSKISTEGIPMNVNSVETAFDKILHDISTTSKIYTVEEGTVIDIPETRNIISDVTVKIGDSSKGYTLDELKAGVNGLVYKEGEGFKWTITGDTLLTNKLSLEYKVDE
jgi:uncharacterized repeat protein (TIGR01451 family)/fimbrial isopeptide formation D2 family protein